MPSYEYECRIHGNFEELQSISAPPLEECPTCAKEGRLERECLKCHALVAVPKDVEVNHCAACQSTELTSLRPVKPKKLISLSSFQLVGSGWARDNYK